MKENQLGPYDPDNDNDTRLDSLVFIPHNRFMQHGNEIQIVMTQYKDKEIWCRTYFPWNIFEEPVDEFSLDMILSKDTVIENATLQDGYCEEGYGYPSFKRLIHALNFIDTL